MVAGPETNRQNSTHTRQGQLETSSLAKYLVFFLYLYKSGTVSSNGIWFVRLVGLLIDLVWCILLICGRGIVGRVVGFLVCVFFFFFFFFVIPFFSHPIDTYLISNDLLSVPCRTS